MRSIALIIAAVWCFGKVAAASTGVVGTTGAQNPQPSRVSRMLTNDEGLRKVAVTALVPAYPATSLAKKTTGVAVAEVSGDPDGNVVGVNILEAPDADISRSVHDAVMQWKFPPIGKPFGGTLVFYFRIEGPNGLVSSPAEMRALRAQQASAPSVDTKSAAEIRTITEAEFGTLGPKPPIVLLDIRDRVEYRQEHRDGALNIPVKELTARAVTELPASSRIVIDCFPREYRLDTCTFAARLLISSKFGDVVVLKR